MPLAMDEVTGILIAVGAMIAGLLLLGWAFGDFNKPKGSSGSESAAPTSSPPHAG